MTVHPQSTIHNVPQPTQKQKQITQAACTHSYSYNSDDFKRQKSKTEPFAAADDDDDDNNDMATLVEIESLVKKSRPVGHWACMCMRYGYGVYGTYVVCVMWESIDH